MAAEGTNAVRRAPPWGARAAYEAEAETLYASRCRAVRGMQIGAIAVAIGFIAAFVALACQLSYWWDYVVKYATVIAGQSAADRATTVRTLQRAIVPFAALHVTFALAHLLYGSAGLAYGRRAFRGRQTCRTATLTGIVGALGCLVPPLAAFTLWSAGNLINKANMALRAQRREDAVAVRLALHALDELWAGGFGRARLEGA